MRGALLALGLLCLWASPAAAYDEEQSLGEPTLDVAFNPGFSTNDLFVDRGGIGLRLAFRPIRLLGVDVMLAAMPDGGTTDYSSLTDRLRYDEEVAPDISRITQTGLISLVTSPLIGRLHSPTGTPHMVAWYLLIGGGAVATRDDTGIIRSPCDGLTTVRERKADTANGCQYVDQVHPAFTWGTGLRGRFFGVLLIGLETRVIAYTEEVFRASMGGGDLGREDKQVIWWSLQVGVAVPPKKAER